MFSVQAQDGVTRFFVDKNATGSNNGTSWTNAWVSPDNISFAVLSVGDTVYVSGDPDSSSTYYPSSQPGFILGNLNNTSGQYTFASGNPVVICPSWEAAHNGEVVWSCTNAHSRILAVGNISNVKITGIKFLDNRTQNINGGGMIQLGNADWDLANGGSIDSLITIDNSHIISKGFASLITLSGTKSFFTNNYMETLDNEYGYEQDQFGVNGGRGGHTITGNIIIARNHLTDTSFSANGAVTTNSTSLTDTRLSMSTDQYLGAAVKVGDTYLIITGTTATTLSGSGWVTFDEDGNPSPAATPANGSAWELFSDAHRDGFQFSNVGYVFGADSLWRLNNERLTTTIANNLYIDYHEGGSHQNNMLYNYGWTETTDARFMIYNNIFVNRKDQSGIGAFGMGRYYVGAYTEYNSIYLLNNTVISKGTSGGMVTTWCIDTLVMKNNLFVKDAVPPNIFNLENTAGYWNAAYKDINYNRYGVYGGSPAIFAVPNGSNYTFTQWQALYNTNGSRIDSASNLVNSTGISFTEKYGLDKADYYTVTGRDSAVDLSATYPFLATDIAGTSRGYNGAWDIGALEYAGGAAPVDTLPDVITLTNISNAELNTTYYAQTGDLTGFDSAYAHINYGEYNIDGGAWKLSSVWTKVYPMNDVYLKYTTGSTYDSVASITLTVGSRSVVWTVTTKSQPSSGTGGLVRGSNGKVWKTANGSLFKVASSSGYVPPAPDTTPPNPPTSFVAIGGTSQTQFQTNWTNPTASDLDSIRYYEGSSNDTTTMTWIVSLPATTGYLRTGRTANTTYWGAVKAVDDSGNVSYFSPTDSATTLSSGGGGTPLANLDLAYLTQSFGAHLYDHSAVGSAGTTTMQDEMTDYNTLNSTSGSLTRITPDYPAAGDMIWHWNQVFYGGSAFSNTQNVITEYANTSTYDILQVVIGFNSAAISFAGWITDASDTATYPQGHIENSYKYWIRNMVAAMELHPDKYWILWNIPAEVESAGNSATDVGRQASFNTWMVDTLQAGLDSYGAFPSNVYIFDIFSLLKNSGNNWMNDAYSDGTGDSHPNATAASYIAPIYIQQVFDKARAYRIP